MTPGIPSFALALVVLALLFAAGGVSLVVRGARRRVGDDRHCRKCEYNLTGLASERCPECGAALGMRRAVIHGTRRRSRPAIVIGGLLTLFAIALAAGVGVAAVRQMDVYRVAPVWLLTYWMNGADVRTAERAFGELDRRYTLGTLSASALDGFIEACLSEQASPTVRGDLTRVATNALGTMILADQLSAAQLRRAYGNMVQLELRTRPEIALGDRVPVQLVVTQRAPTGLWVQVISRDVRLDDDPPTSGSSGLSGAGSVGSSTFSVLLPPAAAGSHRVRADVSFDVFLRAYRDRDQGDPVYKRTRTLEAGTVVIDGPVASGPRPVRSDELDRAVEQAVRRVDLRKGEEVGLAHVSIHVQPTVSIAFEVSIEGWSRARELPAHLAVEAGVNSQFEHPFRHTPDQPWPRQIVLRASRKAAAETVGIDEYWGGTLVLTPRPPPLLDGHEESRETRETAGPPRYGQPGVNFDIRIVDEWPAPATAPAESGPP